MTTLLASKYKSSPVAGVLPLRLLLFFTQNLPKPEMRMSSPDSSVFFISSKRFSITSEDCFLDKPFTEIFSTRSAFVKVVDVLLCQMLKCIFVRLAGWFLGMDEDID